MRRNTMVDHPRLGEQITRLVRTLAAVKGWSMTAAMAFVAEKTGYGPDRGSRHFYPPKSPLSVDHVFIEGISAFEAGHVHDFGNGIFLVGVELFGTGQVAWLYLVNGLWPSTMSPTRTRCI